MAELAMLADIQRIVYPRGGHPSTARHSEVQGKFASQRTRSVLRHQLVHGNVNVHSEPAIITQTLHVFVKKKQ